MNKKLIIDGTVEDIIFSSPESGYSVINVSSDGHILTAVGTIPGCSPGEKIKLYGEFVKHPTYGRQFSVDKCERSMPEGAMDMYRYLSGGAVKGIGPAVAEKIVDRFGDKAFEIIEYEPERLAEIKGISRNKAFEMNESFKKQFAAREIIIALERWSLKPSEALAAYKAFGNGAVERINENPYCLCGEKVGMSFERVDEIAESFPTKVKDIYRQRAVIVYILKHNLNNGHTCVPREKLIIPASAFDIDRETAQAVIDDLVEDKELVEKFFEEKSYIFLTSEYADEKNIAERIKLMLKFPPAKGKTFDKEIDEIEEKNGIKFEEKQRQAISVAVSEGLLVLTGGPGTGKTTTLNGILELFKKKNLRVQLAAPTGRAAMRMSEVTGKKAQTIHRLLEVEWIEGDRQRFARNMQNPLEADAVIIDELSMVDTHIFACLLDALPLGCRLVMVGDSDQLPPVGAGNVLQDIIHSKLIPTVALTEIFRQSMESLIVTNAHKIVRGVHPELGVKDKDFFFLPRTDVFTCAETVTQLCTKRLPEAYQYDPFEDIQIICPSKKGETGTVRLNEMMQRLLNPASPDKEEFKSGNRIFREGDKVMQIKNNYDIVWKRGNTTMAGIFNGDIGKILAVNHNARFMKILFDTRTAIYPFDSVKELELAYAITVHKSQGSEFESVVMPVCSVPERLCYRNLLYTAVTRAKSKLILTGNSDEIFAMVDNDKKTRRYSSLKYLLKEESGKDKNMKYNFDEIIDRKNSDSLKFDFAKEKGLPEDVLPLWVADMDFKAPPSVINEMQKLIDRGIFGYCDTKDDYYDIVCAWFKKRFSFTFEREWLVKTPGVVYALAVAVKAFSKEGESVLIQPPVYYPFYNVIKNNNRKIIENPLVYKDGKYFIDFADFEKKIIENSIKLFILCSPHNPVGRVWKKDELRRMGEICKKHGVIVVADEIHCDFVYGDRKHCIFIDAVPEMKDSTVICTAPSKTFNLAGLQVSNIWIASPALRAKYVAEVDGTGFTVSSNPGILACKAAYNGGEEWFDECLEYIKGNFDYVRSFLKENLPEIKLVEPEGTYLAWLDCSGLGLSPEKLNDLIINKAKLWLDAGDIFGEISADFQRIVLACPRATVEECMRRLKEAFIRYKI